MSSSDEESNYEIFTHDDENDNEDDSHSDLNDGDEQAQKTHNFSNISNLIETDEDSDIEFERILDACRKNYIRKPKASENGENNERLNSRRPCREKMFDSEYNTLPPIELLNINVKEDDRVEKFGVVDSHIGYIVKIIPISGAPHLGFDTILFDSERNPLGEIFEIFGTVISTMYAVRFNSKEEAEEKMPIGKEIYYVVTNENITKPVFPKELAKLKNWERHRSNPDHSSSEEVFSDDEEEQRHLAKRRQKTRHRKNSGQSVASISTVSSIAPKRKKIWQKWPGSHDNPFHPQYKQRQQIHMAMTSTSYQQPAVQTSYGYGYPYFPYHYPYNPYPYYAMPTAHYPQQFMQNPILYNLQNPPPPPPLPPQQPNPHFSSTHQFFNNQDLIPQRPYRPPPPY